MNTRALSTVSAVRLITTSMSFAIRGDVANAISGAFHSTLLGLAFIGLWIHYRARGGYQPVRLSVP